MAFNYQKAIQAGYSPDEINQYVSQNKLQVIGGPTASPAPAMVAQTAPDPSQHSSLLDNVLNVANGAAKFLAPTTYGMYSDAFNKIKQGQQVSNDKTLSPKGKADALSKLLDQSIQNSKTQSPKAGLELGSYLIPFGEGANFVTKAALPGAAIGLANTLSQDNPTAGGAAKDAGMSALMATLTHGLLKTPEILGHAGNVIDQGGNALRNDVSKIQLDPSIGGAAREKAVQNTLDNPNLGIQGNAQQKYEKLQPAMSSLEDQVHSILDNNPKSINGNDVKSQFMDNMQAALRQDKLKGPQAQNEINSYLKELSDMQQKGSTFSPEGGAGGMSSNGPTLNVDTSTSQTAKRNGPTIFTKNATEPGAFTDVPAAPSKSASVKMFITNADEANLKTMGYSQDQINKMKPADAQTILEQNTNKGKVYATPNATNGSNIPMEQAANKGNIFDGQIQSPDLFALKQAVNNDFQAVRKAESRGTPLTPRQEVIKQARQTLDDVIARAHPDVKALTTQQSHLFDAVDSLAGARNANHSTSVFGIPVPSGVVQAGKDITGRTLQGVAQPLKAGNAISGVTNNPLLQQILGQTTSRIPGVLTGSTNPASQPNQPYQTNNNSAYNENGSSNFNHNDSSVANNGQNSTAITPDQVAKAELLLPPAIAARVEQAYKMQYGGLNPQELQAQKGLVKQANDVSSQIDTLGGKLNQGNVATSNLFGYLGHGDTDVQKLQGEISSLNQIYATTLHRRGMSEQQMGQLNLPELGKDSPQQLKSKIASMINTLSNTYQFAGNGQTQ